MFKQLLLYNSNHVGKKLKFKPSHRAYEEGTLGRNFERLPWVVSTERQRDIDSLSKQLRIPSGWPALRKIFDQVLFMKTAERLMLAGPVGAYFFRMFDIDRDYKTLFLDFLDVLRRVMFKVRTKHAHVLLFRTPL